MEQKIIYEGWDPYTHNYNYDEVKVICMLYNRLMEMGRYPEWEDIMKVGRDIWQIFESQFRDADGSKSLKHSWMKVQSHEEAAYIQAWFGRNIDDFIEFFQKNLKIYF